MNLTSAELSSHIKAYLKANLELEVCIEPTTVEGCYASFGDAVVVRLILDDDVISESSCNLDGSGRT